MATGQGFATLRNACIDRGHMTLQCIRPTFSYTMNPWKVVGSVQSFDRACTSTRAIPRKALAYATNAFPIPIQHLVSSCVHQCCSSIRSSRVRRREAMPLTTYGNIWLSTSLDLR